MSDINYDKLPEHIRKGFRAYIEKGQLPGGFIQAVLRNDLRESFARADDINIFRMFDIVSFMYNQAPARCWGSQADIDAWVAKFKSAAPTTGSDSNK